MYKAVQLWFVMQKPDVPAATKAVIMGALGYLIAPLDFLPDLMPVLGYTDDLVAITFALIKVQGYIDDEVERKSKKLLAKIFGEEAVSKLSKFYKNNTLLCSSHGSVFSLYSNSLAISGRGATVRFKMPCI